MPTEELIVIPGRPGTSAPAASAISASIGILLFLLLCFTTVTVWIREAWPLQCFQIGIYTLVIAQVLRGIRRHKEDLADGVFPLLLYMAPLWGIVQIIFHTTTSTFETRLEVLRWGALGGVFYLSQTLTRSRAAQQRLLTAILCFATAMAVLCLTQLNTSAGRLLWFIPTGFSDVYATFQNKNNYVQFVEVALPIAIWGAVREGRRSLLYALAGGVLYASAVASASRAGFVLCTAELITILAIGMVKLRRTAAGAAFRIRVATFLVMPLVAVGFTFAVGLKTVLSRLSEKDPFAIRREFFLGAVEMTKHRPLTGYGLGTFEQVYQQYTIKDFYPFYANHVHNDWAEFAADGGFPFLALVSIPFLAAVPLAFRHPWALGLVATMLHACVDYPFPRPAVSGWMFAVLAALYMTRKYERNQQPAVDHRAATPSSFPRK